MDSVNRVRELAGIGFRGDGYSPRYSADENWMARKKKHDADDLYIDGIEDELDAETEKALARAADTVCRE